MEVITHHLQGQIRSTPGPTQDIYNPSLGEVIRRVALADQLLVNEAVQIASDAWTTWSQTTPMLRSRILNCFLGIMIQNRAQLAQLLSEEHGKTLLDAEGEISRGLEVIEFALGMPHLLKGEYSSHVGTHMDSFSMRQSLGVCVGITPFNFPVMVPLWMFPIALACGNTFILKPSEKNPSVSLLLANWLMDAGLPAGVFQVIQGNHVAVNALLTHPLVKAISFVGSSAVARTIYLEAAKHGKRVQALGGAKNHLVVMPDAEINLAVNGILGAAFGSAGERCMAISVVVAVGAIADTLVEKVCEKAQSLMIGPSTDPKTDIGPLISQAHKNYVLTCIDAGIQSGAVLRLDGRSPNVPGFEQGFFLGPTVFDAVHPQMQIYQQEIFGPVLCIVRVADFDSAIALINAHGYGNGSAIFTQSGEYARAFSTQVETGMVGVNVPIPVPVAYHSFGGWKQSLFGDLAMHGSDGVQFYTRLKTTTTRWSTSHEHKPKLTMPVF